MVHNDFFFDDDLDAAERARRRGNPLLEQPFQPTPLEAILDGVDRQENDAARQNQALETLSRRKPPRAAGPLALTLNGEVLDENTITSDRDLDGLRNNPGIPQLINDRFLVSSEDGRVRVLPERGEDPAVAANFTPAMLRGEAPPPQQSAPTTPSAQTAVQTGARPTTAPPVVRQVPTLSNTPPVTPVRFSQQTLERLPLVGPDEGNILSRPLINARRGALNAAKDLSETRIEPPVRERISEMRQDFGEVAVPVFEGFEKSVEAFVREAERTGATEFNALPKPVRDLFGTLTNEPTKVPGLLFEMLSTDLIGTKRAFGDAIGQLPKSLYRTGVDALVAGIGQGFIQAGAPREVVAQGMLLARGVFDFFEPLECGFTDRRGRKSNRQNRPRGLKVQPPPRQIPPALPAPAN